MIPTNSLSTLKISEVKLPSETYKINVRPNTVRGYIDGLEAVKQSMELILSTERYAYPIYSWNYGIELESLIGKDFDFVWPEIKRRFKDALMRDDRITDVSNFKYTKKDDELLVEFEVVSDYGKFETQKAVNI